MTAKTGATVRTTDHQTGFYEEQHCRDDDYVLVVGPELVLAHTQVYANGTRILTIKRATS